MEASLFVIRRFNVVDYFAITNLYKNGSLYGGEFDEARDSLEMIQKSLESDPDSLLVCEKDGIIIGTCSLVDNGRVAWLFRFAVLEEYLDAAKELYQYAINILSKRGHKQVLVYSDPENLELSKRYNFLGMTQGGLYRCFWVQLS